MWKRSERGKVKSGLLSYFESGIPRSERNTAKTGLEEEED
jgi:hypothetical protein